MNRARDLLRTELVLACLLAIGLVLLVFAGYLLAAPWYGRHILRSLRAIAGEFTCSWDAEALSMTHPNGNWRLRWDMFHSWIDAPQALLIRHSQYQYSLIPKRALTPEQADVIIHHLRRAGVREVRRYGLIASPLGRAERIA